MKNRIAIALAALLATTVIASAEETAPRKKIELDRTTTQSIEAVASGNACFDANGKECRLPAGKDLYPVNALSNMNFN